MYSGLGTHILCRGAKATNHLGVQSQLSSLWSCLRSHQCTLLAMGISLGCRISGCSRPQCLTMLVRIGYFLGTSELQVPHMAPSPCPSLPDGHLGLFPSHTGREQLGLSGSLSDPPAMLYQISVLQFSETTVWISTATTIITAQHWTVYQYSLGLYLPPANIYTFVFGSPMWVPQ